MSVPVRLRPDPLPVADGVELAAEYLPGAEDCCDWYDVIDLPDDTLGIAIADVAGRGEVEDILDRLEEAMLVFGSADGLRTAVLEAMLGDRDHDDDVAVLALAIPHGG